MKLLVTINLHAVTLLNLVIILAPFLKAGFLLATKSELETLSGK